MFGTTVLRTYMSSLDSSSALYFVRTRYNIATAAVSTVCGCGVRREGGGIPCGALVDSAELRYVCILYISRFVS